MGRGARWAAVHGVAKSWTRLSDFTFTFHFHALEKKMAALSSVLAWRIPGTVKPSGLPSKGLHRVGHDWSNLAATVAVAVSLNVCVCVCVCACTQSLQLCLTLQSHGLKPTRLRYQWNSPGKNTGVGSHSLLHQFSSVVQSCPTLCDPMNCSTPGLPIHHQPPEFTQTHAHQVGDAIQPSHLLLSPSPPAPNPSQHQGLFQWVNSSHEVAKVLQFQLQHQSFQWTPRTDLL